jgi:hypothetical protein
MYTSVVVVALVGSVTASSPQDNLTWHKTYAHARKVAQTEKKPVAVFFGSGATGYEKVCKDSQLSAELQKMLADNYSCTYVDVSTDAGQKLAEAFAITKGCGLVLSDRTGDLQAFYHDGDLSNADLTKWVKRFADPNVSVKTTMTNTRVQTSFYPPETNDATGASTGYSYAPAGYSYGAQPGYYHSGGPMWYGGGGGGCPGGRCGR